MKMLNLFRKEPETIGTKAAVAISEPEPVNIAPEPVKIPSKVESLGSMSAAEIDSMDEWMSLNKELGITQRAPAYYELKAFLREEGIQVYNTQSVWDYMGTLSSNWKLFPLRDRDCERYPEGSCKYLHAQIKRWDSGVGSTGKQYDEKVPIPVLLTVKKIVEKFGEDVYFLVAATKIDPFLAVVLRDSSIVFVERWDEPSFRG